MLRQRNKSGILGKDLEAYHSVEIGMTLYGYCCGIFGRDSYGDKVVVRKTHSYLEVEEEGLDGTKYTNTANIRSDEWYDLVQSSNSFLERE